MTVPLIYRADKGVWCLDLRAFDRGRPSLKPKGESKGTGDLAQAKNIAYRMLAEIFADAPAEPTETGSRVPVMVQQIDRYLHAALNGGHIQENTAAQARTALLKIWQFFHEEKGYRRWSQCKKPDALELVEWLFKQPSRKGGTLSATTINHYCSYLKGLVRFAEEQHWVESSFIHRVSAVPAAVSDFERDWLEPHEVGMLLEASWTRWTEKPPTGNSCRDWPWILETEAYTGAREKEVLGLMVSDLTFTGGKYGCGTLWFRHHPHRRLKATRKAPKKAERVFHLWPAHAASLKRYVELRKPDPRGLLFAKPGVAQVPGPGLKRAMWTDLRGQMAKDLAAAGLGHRHITDHSLRHSYITLRSRQHYEQELNGRVVAHKVSLDDITTEVGHSSERMAREVYVHGSTAPDPGISVVDYTVLLERYRKGLGGITTGSSASAA